MTEPRTWTLYRRCVVEAASAEAAAEIVAKATEDAPFEMWDGDAERMLDLLYEAMKEIEVWRREGEGPPGGDADDLVERIRACLGGRLSGEAEASDTGRGS